jgi:hypothetical protein
VIVVQFFDKVIDVSHHVSEEEDTHELDHHSEEVLVLLHRDYVSVPECGECCEHPVYTGYVSGSFVVVLLFLVEELLVNPALVVLEVLVPNVKPETANEVGSEDEEEGKDGYSG